MKSFRNLSIRWKLFGGFGVVLALTAAIGALLVVQLGRVNSGGVFLGGTSLPAIERIDQMRADAIDFRLAQVRYAMLTDAYFLDQQKNRWAIDSSDFANMLQRAGSAAINATDRKDIQAVSNAWDAYQTATGDLAADSVLSGGDEKLIRQSTGSYDALIGSLMKWVADNNKWAAARVRADASTFSSAQLLTVALIALAVLIGLGIAWFVSRLMKSDVDVVLDRLRSLRDHNSASLRAGLEAMSRGDLTIEAEATTAAIENPARDEIGQVADAVNGLREGFDGAITAYQATREQLGQLISHVAGAAYRVSTTSREMAGTSDEAGRATGEIADAVGGIAQGAERQVRMVEDVRRAAEEVAQAVAEAAQNAEFTAEVAHQARSVAEEGVGAAEQANAAMRSVRDSSEAVSAAIGELASKSDQIGAIVETITGIAEQTNLLALNAAIEAARAGEQGRGFAVVAEEVRKLAEGSQAAARQISGLIGAIQTETAHAVAVVQSGAKQTEEGAGVVERTRDAFTRIGSAVEDMAGRVELIAAVSQQITASVNAMQSSIGEVAAVAEQSSASTEEVSASTEQTSASAQQIAASAQELAGGADELNRMVSGFRIG